jgi:hypothetical protein
MDTEARTRAKLQAALTICASLVMCAVLVYLANRTAELKRELDDRRQYITRRDAAWDREIDHASRNVNIVREEHRTQLEILRELRARIAGAEQPKGVTP